MKKRIFLILFMFLATLVLAGCDWFGQKTELTTTSGSEATTTQVITSEPITTTTTTAAPTTAPTTTVTTVTTLPGTVTIAFEENGGTEVTNISQASGTAVTAPTAPTKTGYTFVGWYSDSGLTSAYTFSTMPSSNLTLYAKWQILTFTVNFYDDDGTLILSETVEYGKGATAPTAPYKPGVKFTGWDAAFSNVTGNISINAVYEEHYEPLVLMVLSIGGEDMSVEDIDQMIEMLMFVSEMDTEEETYLMMLDMMGMAEELFTVSSLADFQTWFAQLALEGYDRDRIVGMLVSTILVVIDMESNRYDEQQYLDNIAYFEGELIAANEFLLQQKTAMQNYCLSLPAPAATACQNYLNAQYQRMVLQKAYEEALWPRTGYDKDNKFDYGLYYEMEWNLNMYYEAKYNWEDIEDADYFMAQYNSIHNSLSPELLLLYNPLLDFYIGLKQYEFTTFRQAEFLANQYQDENYSYRSVGDVVFNEIGYNFWNAYYEVDQYEWMIQEEYMWMAENQAEHELLVLFRDYLWSVEGKAKLTTLAGTVYDVAASVVVGIDETTFNMIYGLISGAIDPSSLDLTPTGISGYAHQVADLLALVSSTLDAADAANIISMGHDMLEIYLSTTDMPTEEQAMILALVDVKGPEYFGILSDVYGEIINILNSMTPEKVEAIMTFVSNLNSISMENDQKAMIILVAQLVDALLYDGSVNTDMLVGHFVTVYFDINTQFSADPIVVNAVKLAMIDNINQMIALSHEVALINPENPTVDEMLKMYELYRRGERLVQIFSDGQLEDILDPYDYLDAHEMFLNLIDPYGEMDEGQAEALINVILTTFDLDSEAEVLFTIMQVMELQEFVEMIDSIEDVQELYLMIGAMGFDNATLAGMVARFLDGFSDYMVMYEYDSTYLDEIQGYYEDALAEYDYWTQALTDLLDSMDYEFSLMEDPLLTDVQSAWSKFLYNRTLENDFWMYYHQSHEYNYWDWEDENLYWQLDDMLNRYYQIQGDQMLPPEMQLTHEDYIAQFNMLTTDQHMKFDTVLYHAELNYSFHWTIYYPAMQNVLMNYGGPIPALTSTSIPVPIWLIDCINYYNDYTYYINDYEWQVKQWEEQLSYGNPNESWVYISEFFDDTENIGLVEDVALILLDEIGSLIMYEDTDTYNLVIGLLSGTLDPSTLDLSPAGILALVNAGEDFLYHLFSSMDETDKATVLVLIDKVLYFYLNTLGLTPEETEIMYLELEPKVSNYFNAIFEVKEILTDFMATMTVEKIETVMYAINVMNSLPNEYLVGEELELNDNIVRAVYISMIIDTLLAGDTLNTDYLINLVINGYFDFEYGFSYEGDIVPAELVLYLQTLIDDIIAQAAIVQSYDEFITETYDSVTGKYTYTVVYDDPFTTETVEGMTQLEIDEIEQLRILVEDLGSFMDGGPESYVPVV